MLDLIYELQECYKRIQSLYLARGQPECSQGWAPKTMMWFVVDDLAAIVTDLAWLEAFGKRIIEQHNILDHRRLYLMLFEDGNRIDLTLCPKEHIKEWVDSEADFTVLDDPRDSFSPIHLLPNVIGQTSECRWFCKIVQWILVVSSLCCQGIQRQQFVCGGSSLWYLSERIAEIIGLASGSR